MKKVLLLLLVVFAVFGLAACEGAEKDITSLKITFVPSRDPEAILEFVEPLEEMLKEKLIEKGYTKLESVTVEVSATYEAAGEALDAGTTDIAFLPGGTYALYSEDGNIDVILAATRNGLNKDSADPADWNDGEPTLPLDNQVTYYRSIVVAGPSAKGRELADKVNAGTPLTWEDLNSAKWGVQGATSSAGTVYPAVWLYQNFQKLVSDLSTAAPTGGYGNSIAGLANGTYDVVSLYADARRDYATNWTTYGVEGLTNIWTDTDVIIVTPGIFNDTIAVSNKTVNDQLKKDLQDAFMELVATEEGLAVFAVYSHTGYAIVTDEDYEAARVAQSIVLGQ
ncbi:MAG: phosphonate ABC transporter substrate-binding protein [Tenericutes bacterium HGW-Tenericutes-6]|jgi:phosphonate transport system substrate-binding protein|nr:MAG: phosphonate ABC transporter substrate-binding protein [Tenericutes bacterium HGW-Tenericutes-6]